MKFSNRSIQYKISALTLVVIAVPLLIFFCTITILYNSAFEKRSTQQIKENLTVMSDRVERVINDGILCTNYLTLNINAIRQDELSHEVDVDNKIRSIMNQSLLIFDGIDSIVYIDDYSKMYSTNYDLYDKRDSIMSSSYFAATKEIINGNTTLFDKTSDCMERGPGTPVVTMGKRIVNFRTGEFLGYLFVNLDVNTLEESMQNEITNYFLFDSMNNAIASSKLSDDANSILEKTNPDSFFEMEKINIEGRKYLLGGTALSYNWSLVGVTDLKAYNITFVQLFRTFLVAGILSAVLLFLLGIYISKMLTKPLEQLSEGAEEIANGNLSVEFHFKTNDEIGRLGNIFNHMTKEISKLLKMVEEEAKKKRAYELALIQQQIKPHFLYNTLDIIIMLIEMNRSRDASRVTKKLADYYKNSLSSSDEIISLEKEIRIVEDYLDLQLMRYQDKFTYDISVETDINAVLIPKLTLQPLIENAIYHGLKYKENWGSIFVGVLDEGDNIKITVSDNGVGMSKEVLDSLGSEHEKSGDHFGVYSVIHRLKLYYQDRCNIEINSKEGEGTTFTIIIPRDWREQTC